MHGRAWPQSKAKRAAGELSTCTQAQAVRPYQARSMSSYSPYGKSRRRSLLTAFGLAFAVMLLVTGLMVVGFYVVLAVGISHFGSNK